MKKIIVLLLLFCSAPVINAQAAALNKSTKLRRLPNDAKNDEGTGVPEYIKINFDKNFPKNIAAWTIEDKRYMAEYKDTANVGHIVTYDEEGSQVSVQNELGEGGYPAPVSEYMAKNYPNRHYVVWSMLNADGTKLYYFTQKPQTIWFNPDGTFRNKTDNSIK